VEKYKENDCFHVCVECGKVCKKISQHIKMIHKLSIDEYVKKHFNDLPYLKDIIKYPRLTCGICGELLPDIKKIGFLGNDNPQDELYGSRSLCINENCEASQIPHNAKVTELKMIMFYGKEVGFQKWNEYCDKQAYVNSFEYKQKNHGMTRKEFNEYNQSRAITKENLIKKYGEEKGLEIWVSYCERQAFTTSKEYFKWKYGEIEGLKKYKDFCLNRVGNSSSFTGNGANIFFKNLVKKLPDNEKDNVICFPIFGKELTIYDEEEFTAYAYDFCLGNKIIEFDEIQHKHSNKVKTRDQIKEKLAIEKDYKILRITIKEVEDDFISAINKCLNFLRGNCG